MKIYHGGTEPISNPKIILSQRMLDFGRGFYTTTKKEQAESWAKTKSLRFGTAKSGIISEYSIKKEVFTEGKYCIKIFPEASEEWLKFIIKNRREIVNHKYDIVKGPVANDKLYTTISLFESGILSMEETIKRLKVHKLFDQISFHTEKSLSELIYLNSYKVK